MPRTRQHHPLLPLLLLLLLLWLHVGGIQQVHYKRQFSEGRTFVGNFSTYTTSTILCASFCNSVSCPAWSWDSANNECLVYTYLEGSIQSASSTCSSYLPMHTFIPLWPGGITWSWIEAMIACNTIWATQAYVSDEEERSALEKELGGAYFVGLKKSNNLWKDSSGEIVADPKWSFGYPKSEKCALYGNSGLQDVNCFERFSYVSICIVTK